MLAVSAENQIPGEEAEKMNQRVKNMRFYQIKISMIKNNLKANFGKAGAMKNL